MVSVEALKNELNQSIRRAEEASALMSEVASKLEEVQIRMGNALNGTGDQEMRNILNRWAELACKDANEITEIIPSITSKIEDYLKKI